MSNLIRPLTNADIERIWPLLNQYPVANLYLRDLIDRQGIDYFGLHRWMGAFENDTLVALNADIAAVNPNVPCKLSVSLVSQKLALPLVTSLLTKAALSASCHFWIHRRFWQGLGTPTPLINHPQHVMSIRKHSDGETLASAQPQKVC